MSRIPWAELPEPTVEQMIAVLLSNMHQGAAARIDGRGGDGGRDVQIQTTDGIRAFEIKSFTGRMTPGRRSKVQASLIRAATLAPVDWTLLVPIDPIVRYGGDEFVCGLGGVDPEGVERRFGTIDQALQDAVGVGITVGLASLLPDDTLDKLILRADAALLDGKRRRDE
jgi:GTP cyclohydrolase III